MKSGCSILAVFFIFLLSCRDLVQDEFDEFKPVPVVNSILVADSAMKIHVSLAGTLDSNRLVLVENAEISLYVDGVFREKPQYSGEGIYLSSFPVEKSKSYYCEVSVPGYATVSCADSIPGGISVTGIRHIDKAGKNEEGWTYPAIEFTFTNNPGEIRFYEVVIKLVSSHWLRNADLEKITDPVLLDEGLPIALFSNESIEGSTYTMRLNYFTGSGGSVGGGPFETTLFPVILEVRSVSRNYYLFTRQKFLYEKGRYPEFNIIPAAAYPLFSNITGGYGIFAGYCSMQSDTIFPEHYYGQEN